MGYIKYNTEAAYAAAAKPTDASRVALVTETNDAKIDGVNVITTEPVVGDSLFLDANNAKVFLKGGDQLVPSLIPAGWTFVGTVFHRAGKEVWVVNKDGSDVKYCDVLQFTISAISSTSIAITVKNSAGTNKTVNVTLTAAEINATTAAEINAAIDAANIDSNAWWAYLSDDGNSIIVQCDTWGRYDQNYCAMTGGTIAFTTWGDMPASTVYFKNNGKYSEYRGLMNIARGAAYWGTNGRTPSATEQLGAAGNTDPVKKSEFESSEYCNLLRAAYSSYNDYLYGEYGVKYPQKYGTFALDGIALAEKYAAMTAPTKAGSTKGKYPAMFACYNVNYNNADLATGKWHLPTSEEGCYLLADETLAAIAPTISKMSATAVNNSATRWFVERCNVINARLFYGRYGYLYDCSVSSAYRVQAVAHLQIH